MKLLHVPFHFHHETAHTLMDKCHRMVHNDRFWGFFLLILLLGFVAFIVVLAAVIGDPGQPIHYHSPF